MELVCWRIVQSAYESDLIVELSINSALCERSRAMTIRHYYYYYYYYYYRYCRYST